MKLSIITINYNNKDGLQKTIDSVITQTYKDFEWIIIDGGSTDGSKELIEQYADYITYWVSEPDKGIYNAMNKGILASHGEYLYFLNSGDYLVKTTTIQDVFSKSNGADIINGNLLKLTEPVRRDYGIHSDYVTCFDLFKGNLNHQSTFIKKNLFQKHGLYDESLKIAADWKFFFQVLIVYNCSIQYINIDIACFDMSGLSQKAMQQTKKERADYLVEVLPIKVIEDYNYNLHQSEIQKYKFARLLFSILYRITVWYDQFRFHK